MTDDEIRAQLVEAWNNSEWVCIGSGEDRRIVMQTEDERAASLVTLVRSIAAAELRAAADDLPCWCEQAADYGVACIRHGTANEELHARATALDPS